MPPSQAPPQKLEHHVTKNVMSSYPQEVTLGLPAPKGDATGKSNGEEGGSNYGPLEREQTCSECRQNTGQRGINSVTNQKGKMSAEISQK